MSLFPSYSTTPGLERFPSADRKRVYQETLVKLRKDDPEFALRADRSSRHAIASLKSPFRIRWGGAARGCCVAALGQWRYGHSRFACSLPHRPRRTHRLSEISIERRSIWITIGFVMGSAFLNGLEQRKIMSLPVYFPLLSVLALVYLVILLRTLRQHQRFLNERVAAVLPGADKGS